MKTSEFDILDSVRNGEKSAFDLIFKKYYSELCYFANNYLHSFENAEEIVQEMFLKLWENREEIRINKSLKAYLFKSVQNRCFNYIRDHKISSGKTINIEEVSPHSELLMIEIPENAFDDLFTSQLEEEMEKSIKALPEKCKVIFELCRYENLSYSEIAVRLNVSLSTVKTQMSRAVSKLFDRMTNYL